MAISEKLKSKNCIDMDNSKEYIVAAAYKVLPEFELNNRLIYKHHSLWNNFGKYDDIFHLRIGIHHAEIIAMFHDIIDHTTDGFYTSYGRWVDRKEAASIATKCGQCNEFIMGDRLDSSDLWKWN